MKFTRNILANLKDSGRNVCIYSNSFSKFLYRYSPDSFSEFSSRLYYSWRGNKRPIPLVIALKIMRDKQLSSINIDSFSVGGGNKVTPPNEKEISFYYFLGLILGDGCLVHAKRGIKKNTYLVQISFRNKTDAENIKRLVKNLFGLSASIYPGRGCYALCIFSKPLVLILNKKYQIPIGLKYSLIRVPSIMNKANKKMQTAFLKGLFDSDGNIYLHRNKKSVQLRQKAYKFLKQTKGLFKKININFRDPYYDKANNSWVLWSSKKDLVDKFINEIINFKVMGL